jgi:hypothetical protein
MRFVIRFFLGIQSMTPLELLSRRLLACALVADANPQLLTPSPDGFAWGPWEAEPAGRPHLVLLCVGGGSAFDRGSEGRRKAVRAWPLCPVRDLTFPGAVIADDVVRLLTEAPAVTQLLPAGRLELAKADGDPLVADEVNAVARAAAEAAQAHPLTQLRSGRGGGWQFQSWVSGDAINVAAPVQVEVPRADTLLDPVTVVLSGPLGAGLRWLAQSQQYVQIRV